MGKGLPEIRENRKYKTIEVSHDSPQQASPDTSDPPSPMNAQKERKLRKAMLLLPPMIVSGPKLIDIERVVLWRQQALIGDDLDESLIEISKSKNRMFIISYHSISMRF